MLSPGKNYDGRGVTEDKLSVIANFSAFSGVLDQWAFTGIY